MYEVRVEIVKDLLTFTCKLPAAEGRQTTSKLLNVYVIKVREGSLERSSILYVKYLYPTFSTTESFQQRTKQGTVLQTPWGSQNFTIGPCKCLRQDAGGAELQNCLKKKKKKQVLLQTAQYKSLHKSTEGKSLWCSLL